MYETIVDCQVHKEIAVQKVDQPPQKRRRGRPRDPLRWQRILESARDHFLSEGLERASVDAIAADAGVSKMTIYSHCASKEALFEAVVRDRTDQVLGGIAGVESMDPEFPQQALMAIGEQFLALARDERELGQFRALYGAASTQPLACQAFHRQGAERLISDLASYLERATQAFTLSVADPRLAADLFLAMFLGDGHIRGLLKLPMPNADQNRALLQEAVRVFLTAYENKGWAPQIGPSRASG